MVLHAAPTVDVTRVTRLTETDAHLLRSHGAATAVNAASFTAVATEIATAVSAYPNNNCAGSNYQAPTGCPAMWTENFCQGGLCGTYYFTTIQYGTTNGATSHIPYLAFQLTVHCGGGGGGGQTDAV